VRTLSR